MHVFWSLHFLPARAVRPGLQPPTQTPPAASHLRPELPLPPSQAEPRVLSARLNVKSKMAEVWFWLVIMIAAVVGVLALIVHVHSGGAREFAVEMRGPKEEADVEEGGGDTPTEAAAA